MAQLGYLGGVPQVCDRSDLWHKQPSFRCTKVRLAICEMVLPPENEVPILLDDALVNFDDERMAAALDYLLGGVGQRQNLHGQGDGVILPLENGLPLLQLLQAEAKLPRIAEGLDAAQGGVKVPQAAQAAWEAVSASARTNLDSILTQLRSFRPMVKLSRLLGGGGHGAVQNHFIITPAGEVPLCARPAARRIP